MSSIRNLVVWSPNQNLSPEIYFSISALKSLISIKDDSYFVVTWTVVPFSNVTFFSSVIATIAILKFTLNTYALKNPNKAKIATMYLLCPKNVHMLHLET